MPASTPYSSNNKLMEFIKDKFEAPIVTIGILVAKILPEPTINNTNKHNTHLLIGLRDWFLDHDETPHPRHEAYRGLFNAIISKYDRDDHHARRLDEFLRKWLETDWQFKGTEIVYWRQDGDEFKDEVLIQKDAIKRLDSHDLDEALLKALDDKEYDKVLGLID